MTRRAFLAGTAALGLAAMCRCDGGSPRPARRDEAAAAPPPDTADRVRPAPPDREPVIRVRVASARGPGTATSVGAERQWLRAAPAASGDADVVVLRGPVEVRREARGWALTDAGGTAAAAEDAGPLEIAPLVGEGDLGLGKRRYPGTLRLVPRGDETDAGFDVVNHVALEAYLPGVVAAELFSHWKLETREAQAIAARSFAASEHAFFRPRRHFDVTATAASQVYAGRVTHERTLEAVERTRGTVLAYEGLLVSGYYSACCGGTAAAAPDAIGPNPLNDTPPLLGRSGTDVCTEAPVARWTAKRPVATLSRRLAAWGAQQRREDLADLGRVAVIETKARNPHGRPVAYAIEDRAGRRVELAAEHLRMAADHADGDELPPPSRALWSSHLDVTLEGDTAVFAGRGYGHGVGLCQWGAETLARRGRDAEAIVRWYYPGVELVRAY